MPKNKYLNRKRKLNLKIDDNFIIALINNKEKNARHRIINSVENQKKIDNIYVDYNLMSPNEEEIKDSEIYINDIKVDFYYDFLFPDIGVYTIKYKFNRLLTSTSCMFFECGPFLSLDFSNFNTEKVKNMSYMFTCYSELLALDLSNFNTKNVIIWRICSIIVIL